MSDQYNTGKLNVLVFPCGSEVGLEIHRSLQYSSHFHTIGASSVADHGSYAYADYIEGVPFVDSPDFIEEINQIIKDRDIKFIIPAHDSVVVRLAQAKSSGELACDVVTSDVTTCEITRSKKRTYEVFRDILPVPELFHTKEDLEGAVFPLFLKPDVGQGSKGTQKVYNAQELNYYTEKDPSLLIMEYLPGPEYTIDCFTDKSGTLLYCEGRERIRISGGISVSSRQVKDSRFKKLATKLQNKLSFKGVWFFQVKENKDGDFVLMEIAPRVAGTMGLARSMGSNLVLMSLFDAQGLEVELVANTFNMVIDRALEGKYRHNIEYKHVYLDFDDTVLVDGRINIRVLAFVFQCINNEVKVHLITKHKQALDDTLLKYRLNNVFDEIIWVRDDRQKHTYINHENAIFIDDSHAERKAIIKELGIPVFDTHAVESLIEYM